MSYRFQDRNPQCNALQSSPIQTLLSVPESHRISENARGLYRRSGISPCPEDILMQFNYLDHYNTVSSLTQERRPDQLSG